MDLAFPEFVASPAAQIPATSSLTGILTYRERAKGGFPRYYLYSEDGASLIIAAEEHSVRSAYYDISTNSCVFDKTSPHHVGTMYHVEGSRYCVVVNHTRRTSRPHELLRVSFGGECAWSLSREISLQFPDRSYFGGWTGDVSSILQQCASGLADLVPADRIIHCGRNQLFKYRDAACLALCMTADDEYFFYVAHPLSLFLGFAIALSILRKIRPG
jgi:hypothetical protein